MEKNLKFHFVGKEIGREREREKARCEGRQHSGILFFAQHMITTYILSNNLSKIAYAQQFMNTHQPYPPFQTVLTLRASSVASSASLVCPQVEINFSAHSYLHIMTVRPQECTDPCCNATSCTLRQGAQCSEGPCCSDSCQFLEVGTTCRAATQECDIMEYCSGSSSDCPRDVYRQDGTPCNQSLEFCFSGVCQSLDAQCQRFFRK